MLINSDIKEIEIAKEHLSERFCVDKLDSDKFPLTHQTIDKYQRKGKNISEKLKIANYHAESFHGGGNTCMIICKNYKWFVLKILRNYVVNWYHT